MLLEVAGITKDFSERSPRSRSKRFRALEKVSLNVEEGESVGIVGESGSGKSTLARIVLLLEPPSEGRVLFEGNDICSLSRSGLRRYRQSVQPVFQDPYSSLNPRMRIGSIISEPMRSLTDLDREVIRQRVSEVAHSVGLDERSLRSFPHQFSGGQRQRIALARAISVRPRLLVLDEPVSSLDVSIRAQVLNVLKKLRDLEKVTLIFIAHDMASVKFLTDRVAVMYLGHLIELGPTSTVLSQPAHPYTDELLTSSLSVHEKRTRDRTPPNVPTTGYAGGCVFQPRCPFAMPICQSEEPSLREVRRGHFVACHLNLSLRANTRDVGLRMAPREATNHANFLASPIEHREIADGSNS